MKTTVLKLAIVGGLFINALSSMAQVSVNPAPDKPETNTEMCGAALLHENLLATDNQYRNLIKRNEQLLTQKVEEKAMFRTSQTANTIYQIPVVVHIIHTGEAVGVGNNISDAQVASALEALNNIYRKKAGTYGDGDGEDMEVEFKLATRDPDCNATTGIVRVNGSGITNYATQGVKAASTGANEVDVKNLSRWPNSDYYNIWVVNEIDNNDGGAGIQGYAYFPGASATIDGTVILNSAFGTMGTVKSYTSNGKTLAHEMGHAFNLYHTFEGDGTGAACPPVANGCGSGQGDCVADTEPHKRSASNCPAGTLNTCTGTTIGDVYKNFMDYSSQTCSNQFTSGQKTRLRTAITTLRPGLINAKSLSQTAPQGPLASTCNPTGTVNMNNYAMGIYNVAIDGSAVTSDGTVGENAVFVDRSCNQQFELNEYTNFTLSVNTGVANNENVKVYIDYNNDGDFTDSGELIFNSLNAKSHSGSITPQLTAQTNTPLRVRVISDWSGNAINNPCYVPVYGQVEEYSLKIIAPLPVNLVSFTAASKQNIVNLNWITAQEINNSHFEIERSATGTQDWKSIGLVNGNGTISHSKEYTFDDTNPIKGQNYYRLKQVDYDGKVEYSSIRIANLNEQQTIFSVYPNPGSGLYFLKFKSLPENEIKIRLYALNGQIVFAKNLGKVSSADFSIEDQPTGIYILEVTENQKVTRTKLVKQ